MLCLAGRETLARAGLKQKLHLKIIKHASIRKFKVSPACHVQMSNVSMVKLLSERTSGVPPVIFFHCIQKDMSLLPIQKIVHWPLTPMIYQSSKVWPNWRHDCPPLDTGHCAGYCKHVHGWTLDSVLDVHVPSWMLDISRQGPQIVWRAQLGKDPTKTHRSIQIFYPFHKDFLCHKLTNYFWQLTYVFDKSNAEPLKRSTNREACIEQTATNEETLEVEYLTGQLCAFYPIQNTLKLSVFNCWS